MKMGITLAIPFVLAGCLMAAVIQANTEPDVLTDENKRINVSKLESNEAARRDEAINIKYFARYQAEAGLYTRLFSLESSLNKQLSKLNIELKKTNELLAIIAGKNQPTKKGGSSELSNNNQD